MDFPEIPFGDKWLIEHYKDLINTTLKGIGRAKYQFLQRVAKEMVEVYEELDLIIDKGIASFCARCLTPCCVNRHCFPDFEDLIFYITSNIGLPHLDYHAKEHERCTFLGERGCTLPRSSRSYRCTWYFCDFSLDEFEKMDNLAYQNLENALRRLQKKRDILLVGFRELALQ